MESPRVEDLLAGNSEIALLLRSRFVDADETNNGSHRLLSPIKLWSPTLKNAFSILLNSCCPMFLVWECDPVQSSSATRLLFYNDAYFSLLKENGELLPFGQSVKDSWSDAWSSVQSDIDQVFATGQAIRRENERLPLNQINQTGHLGEQVYTWSYTPIWNEADQPGGVFATGYRVTADDQTASGSDASGDAVQTLQHLNGVQQSPQGASLLQQVEAALRESEETLQRREEELHLVTNALPVLIAYVDKDHYYRFNNQTYETWFGHPAVTYTGRHIRDVLGETAYQTICPYMKRALAGQRVSFESQVAYASGEPRYISADYVPHINSEGEVKGFFSLVSDISDRKRAEAEREHLLQDLAAERARFEAVLRQMPEGVIIADAASEALILANERTSQILKHSFELNFELEAYDQKVPFQAYHPEGTVYAPGDYPLVRSLRTGEVVIHEEMEIRFADGSQIVVDANSSPIFDAQGQITSAVVLLQDITERKQIEHALRASEAFHRTLSEAVPDFIWSCDAQGQADFVNPRWLDYTGLTIEELNAGGLSQVNHPDDMPRLLEQWEIAKQNRESFEAECRYRRWDGEYRWFISRAVPVTDDKGTITRWIGTTTDIHDRKQAEVALRQSEEQARLAIKVGRLGTWQQNFQTNLIELDERMREIWGEVDDAPGISITTAMERIHPDDREQVAIAINAAFAPDSQGTYEIDYRIVWDDGTERWVSANGQVHFEGEGISRVPIRFFGTALDITDRKQTEQALREAEERLRVALQNAPITVFNQDCELKYTWIYNPGLHDVCEMLGKHDRDFLPPEDAEPLTQLKQQVLDTGVGVRQEIRIARDGSNRYYDLTVEPLRDTTHAIIGITCAAIDISNLKQTAIDLRESEARFRGVVESNMVGIFFWDMSGCLTDGNEMAVQMLGYSRDELQARQVRWQDITPPEFHEISTAMQTQLLAESVCTPFEKAYIRKDGTQIPILIGGALLPGYHDRGVAYFIDITDRKQAEAEREQLLSRERAVREDAEQANRIKDEFLAVLSHELRSPLNPILGWAKLLQTRQFDEAGTKRALETIERNAKLQTQLIDDLLDVSRILRGKLALNVALLNLDTLIDAALETVRLSFEAKGIEMQKVVADDVGLVAGDAGRLQQVVWNLLSNAVKFTPEGGRIEVHLERVERDRGIEETGVETSLPTHAYAQITVRDTGKGIAPEFLPHVFDYFRQEDSTTTRKFGGLGLGLAIVRYLTELHGGTIKAESAGEAQGATFTIRLPLQRPERIRDWEREGVSVLAPPVPHQPLMGLRVLVVDDEADMRDLISAILEQAGAETTVMPSALDALKTLNSLKPDVLISDIGMPDMDGYALLRQIRSLPPERGGRVPAIALTAYAGEINQQQVLAAGFQQHIAKPVEPEVLVQAISRLAQRPPV